MSAAERPSFVPLPPPRAKLRLVVAHNAFDIRTALLAEAPDLQITQTRDPDELRRLLPQADALAVSMMWENDMLDLAPRLKYVQSISSGANQYDLAAFRARGVALCSARGANRNAVSEHAIGLLLSLSRKLGRARDRQKAKIWPATESDPALREGELAGKTLLVVGLGAIGDRIARIARAFDMRVIGLRRDPARGPGGADEVRATRDLPDLLPSADAVILCCPLTEETRHLIDARALARMKRTAFLINVARGGCVDEPALIEALAAGRIAGAGIDVTEIEPLPAASPLWGMENVILTPHSAAETPEYEANVAAIMLRNLDRLWRGDGDLENRLT